MPRLFAGSNYVICAALLGVWGTAFGDNSSLTLSAGVEHASGHYDSDHNVEELYVPVSINYSSGSMGYGLTIPYLSVRAPQGTIITNTEGQVVVGEGPITTESGLGDVSARITFYDLLVSKYLDLVVDVSAKVKLGTADENKGLGTGETDYSLQADIYKFFDGYNISASVGYKLRGDPAGLDLKDVWFGSLGSTVRFSPKTKAGVSFDYRQSSFEDGEAIQELNVFVSHRMNKAWSLQLYTFTGFSESSPDWGGGALIKYYL